MAGQNLAAQRKAAALGISVDEYKAQKLAAYKREKAQGRRYTGPARAVAVQKTETYVARAPARPAPAAAPIVPDDPLAAAVAAARAADAESPLAARLAKLMELSLKRAEEIMSIELDPDMPGLKDIMARQSAVMSQVFSADRAAGNGSFRQRNDDRLGQLLSEIKKEKALATQRDNVPKAPAFLSALEGPPAS